MCRKDDEIRHLAQDTRQSTRTLKKSRCSHIADRRSYDSAISLPTFLARVRMIIFPLIWRLRDTLICYLCAPLYSKKKQRCQGCLSIFDTAARLEYKRRKLKKTWCHFFSRSSGRRFSPFDLALDILSARHFTRKRNDAMSRVETQNSNSQHRRAQIDILIWAVCAAQEKFIAGSRISPTGHHRRRCTTLAPT